MWLLSDGTSSLDNGIKLLVGTRSRARCLNNPVRASLSANFMRSDVAFSSSAALASSRRTRAILSFDRTCHLEFRFG
jgi:hypothetical protein